MAVVTISGTKTNHVSTVTHAGTAISVSTQCAAISGRAYHPGNWVALNQYDDDSHIPNLFEPKVIGIQVKMDWNLLETSDGVYDMTRIRSILDVCEAAGRYLIIHIRDKNFTGQAQACPTWWDAQYTLDTVDSGGHVSKRWDPYVYNKFIALVAEINTAFGDEEYFEGIAIQESAIGLDDPDGDGYDGVVYAAALQTQCEGCCLAMPTKRVFWFMNFISTNNGAMDDIAQALKGDPWNLCVGGPDILPGDPSLESTDRAYYVIRRLVGEITFNSCQYDSYNWPGVAGYYPPGGQLNWSPLELLGYARDSLSLNYVIWNSPTNAPANEYDIDDANAAFLISNPPWEIY